MQNHGWQFTSVGFRTIAFHAVIRQHFTFRVAVSILAVSAILSAVANEPGDWTSPISVLRFAVGLAFGLPNGFNRLHDTDKSGWWLLVNLIPIVGWIYIIYLVLVNPGDVGPNQYGLTNSGGTPFPSLHEDSPVAGR